ncbi:hypothetical protein [Streptomyces californicus]
MPREPESSTSRPLFELHMTVHRIPGELVVALVAILGALVTWITTR